MNFLKFKIIKTCPLCKGKGHYKFDNIKNQKEHQKFANHHYIENSFLVDHYNNITTSKMAF